MVLSLVSKNVIDGGNIRDIYIISRNDYRDFTTQTTKTAPNPLYPQGCELTCFDFMFYKQETPLKRFKNV